MCSNRHDIDQPQFVQINKHFKIMVIKVRYHV